MVLSFHLNIKGLNIISDEYSSIFPHKVLQVITTQDSNHQFVILYFEELFDVSNALLQYCDAA